MNKQDIINEMRVEPIIDPKQEVERRVAFIQQQLTDSGCKSLVLGISGGVDSFTCGSRSARRGRIKTKASV